MAAICASFSLGFSALLAGRDSINAITAAAAVKVFNIRHSPLMDRLNWPLDVPMARDVPGAAAAFFSPGRERLLPSLPPIALDRKSTRLNSSHMSISYAVFCLKKKKKKHTPRLQSRTHNL